MAESITVHKVLDAKGLVCPIPVIKARKAIRDISLGQVLEVQATDKGAVKDFEAWARQTGNELVEWTETGGIYVFHIRKAKE